MLTLITGMPGNGKTLRAMALIEEEWKRNQDDVKKGKATERQFFTNIAGATREENPDAFPFVQKMPADNDWTKLPDGSFVVYDEAHADGHTPDLERYGTLFPSTGKPGESNDPRIRAMSTHRHRGFDIVLITQWPSKIHHQVRSLVGKHIHMNRSMGLQAAGVYTWTRVQVDPYDEKAREKGEEEVWSFDKSLYHRYKSSTLHTSAHKFKFPKKIKNGLITATTLVVMLVVFWKWMGWDVSVFFGGGESPQTEAREASPAGSPVTMFRPQSSDDAASTAPLGTGVHDVLTTAPAPSLMGCVSSDRGCRCFNVDGFQIDMSTAQCNDVLSRPLPFNIAHKFERVSGSREREREGDRAVRPSDPVSGFTSGSVGSVGRPTVDPSFGTITRPVP